MTYPSMFNGFEKKLKGTWSVGLLLKVPIWEWGEGKHKVAAAKADAAVAGLQLQEAREKITLQVNQTALAVNQAVKNSVSPKRAKAVRKRICAWRVWVSRRAW